MSNMTFESQIVATFYKVRKTEFRKHMDKYFAEHENDENLDKLKLNVTFHETDFLPKRATKGSAGYDFKVIGDYTIPAHSAVVIPTYVKCKIEPGWVLMIYPRSSFGFKYSARLANTVGIIDSDYYSNEDNDGHIMIKITNPSDNDIEIKHGDRFAQGIFMPFGITTDDSVVNGTRSGGIGSTGK